MNDSVSVPNAALTTPPLSQGARVVDTFIAPSKTFTDVLRSSSWWAPWLIGVVVSILFALAIQQKIGWDKVYDNILRQSPKQAEQMQQMTPEQAAKVRMYGEKGTEYTVYASPVLSLLFAAIAAGVLLATVDFGFGGRAKFSELFAVWFYATLPLSLGALLTIIAIYAGLDADSFNIKNAVGTNIGYYLSTDSPKWLVALGTSLDLFTIWTLVLLTIGCSIVGRIKRGNAAIAVFGWWVLITLIKVGAAAM